MNCEEFNKYIFILCSSEQNVEIRANLNNVVDALLPYIRQFILNHGMDPMQLPNVSTHIFPHLVCM